jgi:hypothetical protein
MSSEESSGAEGNIEGTIKAVTGLVKEVPVYVDAIQPVAKETGKALQTLGRTVNAALMPVRGLVWGFEKIEEFVNVKVTKKLENVPIDKICTPDLAVAGPALESLKYTGHKESLNELYANLLASAMDLDTAKTAHPGFVEIIRNMSADEAKILTYIVEQRVVPIVDINRTLANGGGQIVVSELISMIGIRARCEHQELTPSYLINLERLGLIEIPRHSQLMKANAYYRLTDDPSVKLALERLEQNTDGSKGELKKHHARVSVFGKQFSNACVVSRDKNIQANQLDV